MITRTPIFYPTTDTPYGYVYLTTDLTTGKMYVGQHAKSTLDKSYIGSGIDITRLKKRHGLCDFDVKVLEWASDPDDLDMKEIWWINFFDAVESEDFYNRDLGGSGGFKAGEYHPMNDPEKREDFIQKIRDSRIGTKMSQSARDKISKAMSGKGNSFYGKHHTQESIEKMKAHLPDRSGKNNANYGKKWTEEQKQRQSEKIKAAQMGKPGSFSGRHHTDDSKKKMKESWDYSKHFSDETKRRMSESHKGLYTNVSQMKGVIQLTLDGQFVQEFQSLNSAAREVGCTSNGIIDCCKHKTQKFKGFIWKYSTEYYSKE